MIRVQQESGGMHSSNAIISCVPCFTIVPESSVFGVARKSPAISKARNFIGMADGISQAKKFLMKYFQCLMWPIDNRMGMIRATPEVS